ncbi:hypothetical protein H0H81_002141 [Sphagnurus paluster]|uniref:Uncharacterized protein n=1 Tax=Sphagnurus paluster TaxID=117069 RepID=A0A9P7FS64_9AGAR|nr:hypothetical protein H0H81_002141 [Sphagnurus paluster]
MDESLYVDSQPCPGAQVLWPDELGPFNDTFPWSQIGDEPGSLPFTIEVHERGRRRIAWAKTCWGSYFTSTPCPECTKVPDRIHELASMSLETKPHTNLQFRNPFQLRAWIHDRKDLLNQFKLQALNTGRKLATLVGKVADYGHLVFAVANSDVPRVQAIFQAALKNGSGIRTITRTFTTLKALTIAAWTWLFSSTVLVAEDCCIR